MAAVRTTPAASLGRRGEELAAACYERRGYEILARNWRCRGGEIDLIARRATQIVFCEVKARSSDAFGLPVEAVTPSKQLRVRRLAALWLAGRPDELGFVPRGPIRFDVVSIIGPRMEIVEAAF